MELTPLRRASSGAVLGGVCAGLARRWQVDPTVLRIAMVLLALIGGLGVAFYVGAMLLVPKDGSTDLPLHRFASFTRTWSPAASIGAVVALGVLITVLIGSWLPFGIAPAVGLGFLWYFGFYRRRRPQPPAGTQPDASAQVTSGPPVVARPSESMTDFERAAAEWQQRVAEERWARAARPDAQPALPDAAPTDQAGHVQPSSSGYVQPSASGFVPLRVSSDVLPSVEATGADAAATVALPAAPTPDQTTGTYENPRLFEYRPTPPPAEVAVPHWTPPATRSAKRRPRPRWLWPLVLCLVGGGLATLAVLSTVFAITVPPLAYAGTVLGALGLGLLIAAFAGRPRGLLPLSVLSALVTVVMLVPLPSAGPVGDETFAYTTMSQLPGTAQSHGVGDVTLDLAGLAITQSGRYEFSSGLGDLDVKLPATGNVVIEWKTGLGDYSGPDGNHEGPAAKGTFQRITDPSAPTLTLVLSAGVGDLRVTG